MGQATPEVKTFVSSFACSCLQTWAITIFPTYVFTKGEANQNGNLI